MGMKVKSVKIVGGEGATKTISTEPKQIKAIVEVDPSEVAPAKQKKGLGVGVGRQLIDGGESFFDSPKWAENVLYVLKAKGIPVGEFESQMGMGTGQISRYKSGAIKPKIDLVFHISKELGIDVSIMAGGSLQDITQVEIDKVAVVKALKEDTEAGKMIWRNVDEPYKFSFYNRDPSAISVQLDDLTKEEEAIVSEIERIQYLDGGSYFKSVYPDQKYLYIARLPGTSTFVYLVDDESTEAAPKGDGVISIYMLDVGAAVPDMDGSEIFEAYEESIDGSGCLMQSYSREEALALQHLIRKGERSLKPKTSTEKAILTYMNNRK